MRSERDARKKDSDFVPTKPTARPECSACMPAYFSESYQAPLEEEDKNQTWLKKNNNNNSLRFKFRGRVGPESLAISSVFFFERKSLFYVYG